MTRRTWPLVAPLALLTLVAACGTMMESPTSSTNPDVERQPDVADTGTDADSGGLVDPCVGISNCDAIGATCDGDQLVECRAVQDGCLVEVFTECDNGCDASGASAECIPGGVCAGVQNCSIEGSSCDADGNLNTCAADDNGCLVETIEVCTWGCESAGAFSWCNEDDPCADIVNTCDDEGTACDGDVLVACTPNADGCLTEIRTDCAVGAQQCLDTGDGMDCVHACDLVDTCDDLALCDGDDLVTCEPDENGCLVEVARTDCTDDGGRCASGETPACEEIVEDMCAVPAELVTCGADPIVLTGTVTPGTGATTRYCDVSFSYEGVPAIYEIQTPANATVNAEVTWDSGADLDLMVLDGAPGTCLTTSDCLTSTTGGTLSFDLHADGSGYLVVDLDGGTTSPISDIEVTITCEMVICGDGSIDAPEACDDGNTDAEDGCSALCQIEPGWACDADGCHEITCGDGILEGDEACEDGNADAGDGCSDTCAFEDGWICDNDLAADPITACHEIICGDGIIEGDEACDDGNGTSDDGCSIICGVEDGFVCTNDAAATPQTTCRPTICGDGIVEGDETCDDANLNEGDGCTADCAIEDGYACVGAPSVCLVEGAGETCDDAIVLTPGLYHFDNSAYSNTYEAYCGSTRGTGPDMVFAVQVPANAILDVLMTDDGGDEYLGVSTSCPDLVGSCVVYGDDPGDGYWQNDTGEDLTVYLIADSYADGTDAGPFSLSVEVTPVICGDGLIAAGETCDDGNTFDGDGCSSACSIEDASVCEPGEPSVCRVITCGDGYIDSPESCDDGNTYDGDGCSGMCASEPDWICDHDTTRVPATSCREVTCGDGFIDGDELCDDGNLFDADGCDSACEWEPGYLCEGEPSVCEEAPPGDLCSNPIWVDPGVGTVTYDRADFTDQYDGYSGGSCGTSRYGRGPETVFAIEVPPGAILSATEHEVASYDTTIALADRCPDINSSCLAYRDDSDGTPVSWANDTGEPQTIYILADSYSSVTTGTFTMDVELEQTICGDGVVETATEACDDGNTSDGDGCSSTCVFEDGFICASGEPTVCREVICGDGFVETSEACDDGNATSGDGCSSACELEAGWECDESEPTWCFETVCGDGWVEGDEACDDRNPRNGDGCSSACTVEDGWACSGEPSSCIETILLVSDTIDASDTESFHPFTLRSATSVVIETTQTPGESTMDTQIWVCEASADCAYASGALASNDDGGSGLFSLITIDLAAGDYKVGVQEYGRNSTGAYTLEVREAE